MSCMQSMIHTVIVKMTQCIIFHEFAVRINQRTFIHADHIFLYKNIKENLQIQKSTDLDLQCLLRQGMSCLARAGLRQIYKSQILIPVKMSKIFKSRTFIPANISTIITVYK